MSSPDFKTTVLASIHRLGDVRLLRRREALLIGQTARGTWTRLRIPVLLSWCETAVVRGFIKRRGVDRLAILVTDEFKEGWPQRLRLDCVDRASPADELLEAPLVTMPGYRMQPGLWALRSEPAYGRLARLAAAARLEWSGVRAPMLSVLGRPWPLAVLAAFLFAELVVGLLRMRSVMAGEYSWLPVLPYGAAVVVYALYLVLVGVTGATLWRQTRLGYVLALSLAAVQFARPIALAPLVMQTGGSGELALWLGSSWLLPAFICYGLGILYQAKHSRSGAAPPALAA